MEEDVDFGDHLQHLYSNYCMIRNTFSSENIKTVLELTIKNLIYAIIRGHDINANLSTPVDILTEEAQQK